MRKVDIHTVVIHMATMRRTVKRVTYMARSASTGTELFHVIFGRVVRERRTGGFELFATHVAGLAGFADWWVLVFRMP